MLCPQCKTEISDESLKCPNCGAKVGRVCPNCKAHNPLTAHKCKNCDFVLLKMCPNCGATNMSKSTTCRRCGASLVAKDSDSQSEVPKKSAVVDVMPKYEAVYYSQQKAKDKLKENVLDDNIRVISILGDSGAGKSLVVKFVSSELKDDNTVWLTGKCSVHSKLTPCGFLQDVFINLFNLNSFCIDMENLKKETMNFFKQDFPDISSDEVLDFVNFLYPEQLGEFKTIHSNRQKTFGLLYKIFRTISLSAKVILVVDNFSQVDNMSLEFIKRLLSDPELKDRFKVILTYSESRSALACLPIDALEDSAYSDISLAPLNREHLAPVLDKYKNLDLSTDQKNLIHKYSAGNPANFEQYINLTADKLRNGIPFSVPQTTDEVIKERLDILKTEDNIAYRVLTAICVLGYKSNPIVLNMFNDVDLEQLDLILNKLSKLNFIVAISNVTYEFKSIYLWELILNHLKEDKENYRSVCDELFVLLQNYHLSSLSALSLIAGDLGYTQQYLSVWTTLVQTASYLGDITLFVTAQKHILEIVENNTIKSSDNIKKNIYVQSGKLLEKINPKEGLEFLTKALSLGDLTKYEEIDLLAYIASCAKKTENYYGVIECVDNVLDKFEDTHSIEVAVIKSRKLGALNKIGNFGEVVNIAENEIIPIIEATLAKKKFKYKWVSEEEVFESWIYTLYDLTKALTRQGNDRAFKVINELFKILEANNIHDNKFFCKLQLELALANTIKGNIPMSEKILNDIYDIYKNSDVINSLVLSRLNLIGLLNKFFTQRDKINMDELFEIAEYADNINDKFTKNISKLILGKIILETQSAQSALNVYTKQLEYFANEKNAVGVLLGWYLTAEATMLIDKQQALDIANRALSIAQKPEICNYYFSLLFDKLICRIYLSLKDYESARIYSDRALTIAKGYDIKYQLAKLYLISGDCHKIKANTTGEKEPIILSAREMYDMASKVNEVLKNNMLTKSIQQKMNELDMMCKANGIKV